MRKRNVRLSDFILELLQAYADTNATIDEYFKRYAEPELSELFDSIHNTGYTVVDFLLKELKIKGKPDLKVVEDDYTFYEMQDKVKPEYRKPE
jgi:hypothetical protein